MTDDREPSRQAGEAAHGQKWLAHTAADVGLDGGPQEMTENYAGLPRKSQTTLDTEDLLDTDSDNYHQDHQHKTTTVGSQAGPGSIHLTSDKSRVPENTRLASGNNGDPRNTNREGVGGPGSGNLDLILDRINFKRVRTGSNASSGLSSGPSDSTSDRGMTGGSAGGTRDSSDGSTGTGRMTGGADHGGGNSGMSAVPGKSEIASGSRDGGSGPLAGTPGGRGGLSYFGGGSAGISNIPGQVTAGDSSSTRGSGNSDNTGGSRSLGDLLSGSLEAINHDMSPRTRLPLPEEVAQDSWQNWPFGEAVHESASV